MQTNIEERVQKILAEQFAINMETVVDTKGSDQLRNDLGFDDLDIVEITMGIEDEFGLEIDDDAMNAFKTVQDIVDHVTAEVKA